MTNLKNSTSPYLLTGKYGQMMSNNQAGLDYLLITKRLILKAGRYSFKREFLIK